MDPVAQPVQPIGIEDGRPQAKFLAGLLRSLQAFWSKELHRLNRVLPKDGTEAMTGPLELKTYTVATLPTASDFTGSVVYVSDGGPAVSGALVSKSLSQSIPDSAFTNLVWQTENYDDGGWFASSGDDFLTVPTGVTRVQMHGSVEWGVAAGTVRFMNFIKGVSVFPGQSQESIPPTAVTIKDFLDASTSPVDAVAGDQLKLNVFQESGGGSLNIITSEATSFGVEAVEFAEGYGGTFQGSNGTRWVPLG